jgi:hypothetical protein
VMGGYSKIVSITKDSCRINISIIRPKFME